MKPTVKRIYSENNDFQRIEVVKRNRVKRNRYGEFFVEGVKPINFLIKNNWTIKSFVYPTGAPISNWAKTILNNSKAQVHFELPLNLMDKLSDKEEKISEIIAIASIPKDELSRIDYDNNMLIVIVDRPSSYGNLGTLIRSCEAMGVDGIIITGHAVDIYDPRTIRASMGTLFTVPVVRLQSHNQLVPWFGKIKNKYGQFKVVGSSAGADRFIMDANLKGGPLALIIGNETRGLSHNYRQLCDMLVKIPMYGKITSFNIACATSIMLYEITRQRNL